ncbi:ANTAR domain-containing protein [Modestobacter sp. NPDC049651]|uniref:ANTAR domain-containing protein n=1 Tax=unclassified Modestobacter TaxID=2643866 RepID=UPI0034079E85
MTPSVGRTVEQDATVASTVGPALPWGLPEDVLRTPAGAPAAVVVRTPGGWRVLSATDAGEAFPGVEPMPLVEAMTLADLVAQELGSDPEPDRQARRAARGGEAPETAADPRDVEIAELRRTVAQLEHALAARVSIERAIGVLAERHSTTPREAFDQLRRRARSAARPAAELAREVLDGLAPTQPHPPVPGPREARS